MKQIIFVISMAIIILVVSMSLVSVDGKAKRRDELNRAVSAAVKQTVKTVKGEKQNEIQSDQEMVGEFIHLLSVNLSGKGDYSIEVFGVDSQKGMLDVKVTETCSYLNGEKGKVSVRKCAIYD